jgi:hypothetical protein
MTIQSLDHSATLFLNFDGGVLLDRFMWFASEKFTWLPLYLLLLWFVARKWGWRYMLVVFVAVVLGVGLSDQICNFFKETFQVSFKEYVTQLRVAQAQLALSGAEASVSHIIEELGYTNATQFYHTFRRYTGMTPAEYRKARRRQGAP